MTEQRFVLNQPVEFEETLHHEFKEVKGTNPVDTIKNVTDEYVVAFLNSKGGSIYWGIRDSDRVAVGVVLNSKQRDEVRRVVTQKLTQIQPSITPTAYKIILHRLYSDEKGSDPIPNLYIVEVVVPPVYTNTLYFTGSNVAFVKTDAGKKKLTGPELHDEIQRRLRERTQNDEVANTSSAGSTQNPNEEGFPKKRINIWVYIIRGIVYAVTSGLALLAGYFIQSRSVVPDDLRILSIPMTQAIFFFICYANKFHNVDSEVAPSDEMRAALQGQAPYVFLAIGFFYVLYILGKGAPSYYLVVAFALYAVLFVGYGIYLIKFVKKRSLPLVRHQLVWPAILSIAISFFYGIEYKTLSSSLVPLLPLSILLVLFVFSEIFEWSKRAFIRRSFLAFFAVSVLSILIIFWNSNIVIETAGILSAMLFSLSIAAYLAVFESWRVAADIARRTTAITNTTGNLIDPITKALQYVIASLGLLAGTMWVLPIYFIFSNAGISFLLLFAFHAALAFIFWFYTGVKRFLLSLHWAWIKLAAGLLFLTLLVLTNLQRNPPSSHLLKDFVSWNGIAILFIFASLPIGRLSLAFRRLFRRNRRSSFSRLFENRINIARLLSLICWLTCFPIVLFLGMRDEDSPAGYRAEYSFCVYGGFILVALVLEILESLGLHRYMRMTVSLIGFLQTIRILTSLFIGAIVALPCTIKGVPFIESILMALPFCLAAMGGFALNDYYDIEKDRINKPHRAIPSMRLSSNTVLTISITFIVSAILTALLVRRDSFTLILYLTATSGILVYNVLVKYFALSKTLFTAIISSLPIFFVVKTLQYSSVYLLAPISTMIFLFGRELLMDVTDIDGDKRDGIITVPMLLGKKFTTILGFSSQVLGASLLFPILLYMPVIANALYLSGIFSSICIAWLLWRYRAGNYQRQVIVTLWLPMILGVLMLLD